MRGGKLQTVGPWLYIQLYSAITEVKELVIVICCRLIFYFNEEYKGKQGRIHGYPSRVLVEGAIFEVT